MRLDKYLKVSRLIKRRTVANEACDGDRVTVNGKPAKASYDVKVGDRIELRFGRRARAVPPPVKDCIPCPRPPGRGIFCPRRKKSRDHGSSISSIGVQTENPSPTGQIKEVLS